MRKEQEKLDCAIAKPVRKVLSAMIPISSSKMKKRVLIVGASSGIGKALALLMVEKNFYVGITGRRKEKLLQIQAQAKGNIFISVSDAIQPSATKDLDLLVEQMGGMDLFIVCAGVGYLNDALDYNEENKTNQLNVIAFTKLVNWGIHFFYQQGKGHLVNISSVAQHRGGRAAPAYNASKAYQSNYFEGLHQKVFADKKPIVISDIRPGFVKTAMAKGKGRFWEATKEKAALQIYHAILRKRPVAYITKRWLLIGYLLTLLPRWLYKRL